MRLRARVDANQSVLVAYARAHGASWLDLSRVGKGCPDGIIGIHGRDFKVEIKTATGSLTADQTAFIALWRGSPVHVLRTLDDVDRLLRSVVPNKRAPKATVVKSAFTGRPVKILTD